MRKRRHHVTSVTEETPNNTVVPTLRGSKPVHRHITLRYAATWEMTPMAAAAALVAPHCEALVGQNVQKQFLCRVIVLADSPK